MIDPRENRDLDMWDGEEILKGTRFRVDHKSRTTHGMGRTNPGKNTGRGGPVNGYVEGTVGPQW